MSSRAGGSPAAGPAAAAASLIGPSNDDPTWARHCHGSPDRPSPRGPRTLPPQRPRPATADAAEPGPASDKGPMQQQEPRARAEKRGAPSSSGQESETRQPKSRLRPGPGVTEDLDLGSSADSDADLDRFLEEMMMGPKMTTEDLDLGPSGTESDAETLCFGGEPPGRDFSVTDEDPDSQRCAQAAELQGVPSPKLTAELRLARPHGE